MTDYLPNVNNLILFSLVNVLNLFATIWLCTGRPPDELTLTAKATVFINFILSSLFAILSALIDLLF